MQLLFFQENLSAQLTSAQINPSVQAMFTPVNLFAPVMIVQVNPLVLLMFACRVYGWL